MKLKLGHSTNKTLGINNQREIFENIFEKEKNIPMNNNNLSGENLIHMKNNENINLLNMNNCSILEYNDIKQKNSKKKGIHSASRIKTRSYKAKEVNKSLNLIYNIKQIHQIISIIQKKINSLNDISKDNNINNVSNFNFSSIISNSSYNNQLHYRNKENQKFRKNFDSLKSSRTFVNSKNDYFSSYKDNKENNTNANLKKRDLIPYPFKRLQNKIRKYFSLCKNYHSNCNNNNNNNNIKLFEEHTPAPTPSPTPNPTPPSSINYPKNCQYLLKIKRVKENNFLEKRNEKLNIYGTKIFRNNIYNSRNIIKKDKSVSTDNIIIRSYLNNNDTQKIHTLFNNKLIASLTKNEKKFFLTTSNKTKDKDNNRNILVYYKSY